MKTVAELKDEIGALSDTNRDELRHWLDVHQDTREIIELVHRLTQCHAIWWRIVETFGAKKHENVSNEYNDFFKPVAHVLLWHGFFVICAQIFAKDTKQHSSKHVQALIDVLKAKDAALADRIEQRVNSNQHLKKFKEIRNKISAHRQAGLSPDLILKKLKPLKSELNETVKFAQEIISQLAEALGVENANSVMKRISECSSAASNDTFRLIEDLGEQLNANESGK